MKRVLGAWFLVIALAFCSVTVGLAESVGAPPASLATQARELSAQVSEISHSTMISRTKKEKRIATAVRVAVVAATAYKQDPGEIMGIGLELAAAAARAAPPFTEVIANAISFAPAIARIDGAASRIRTEAFAAAKTPESRRQRKAPATEYVRTATPPSVSAETAAEQTPARSAESEMPTRSATSEAATRSSDIDYIASAKLPSPSPTTESKAYLGANSSLSLTADVGARYDDNIFWSQNNKVGDTIVSAAPGVEYRFGQNSLAHGGISYKETFARYLDNSAPQVDLGTGSADFGYADEKLTLAGSASYNQLDQNNPDILQRQALLRSNVFGVGGSAESQLTAKISAKLGVDYSHTGYQTAGLVDYQHEDVPLSLYFITTPKLDLSAGVTYGVDRPDGGGPTGKDLYYNVGVRGSLTPKLSAEFSVGEQTRKVANYPGQHLLGFDGSFTYEVTPKTNAVLALSRGFSVSALGESLVNGTYRLGLTTDLTPQWQVGTNLTYRSVDYGTTVFVPPLNILPELIRRKDNYWEGGLSVTYLYSQRVSASLNYTYRGNQSNIPAAEFNDNILGLMLGLRY
jgi:hypothetical protein